MAKNNKAKDKAGNNNAEGHGTGPATLPETQEVAKVETPMMVWVDDVGDYVQVSREMMERARLAESLINRLDLIRAFVIKMVHDENLWIAMGCSSFKDYCERKLPFGRTKAYQHLKIANHYLPKFDEFQTNGKIDVQKMNNLFVSRTDDRPSSESKPDILSLSLPTLLASIDDADFEEMETDSETETANVAREMIDFKKKSAAKYAKLDEECKQMKAELELARNDRQDALEAARDAEEIQSMYGAKASKIEDKRRMMESAREHIYKAEQYMVQAGVDETDPDGIQRDMLDLIKRMQFSIEKAKNNYFFLVKELEAYE